MSAVAGKQSQAPRWAELQELEGIATELMTTALQLPLGPERRETLISIGGFRRRIAAMKQSDLGRAGSKAKLAMKA
jgi:hypothetical protein